MTATLRRQVYFIPEHLPSGWPIQPRCGGAPITSQSVRVPGSCFLCSWHGHFDSLRTEGLVKTCPFPLPNSSYHKIFRAAQQRGGFYTRYEKDLRQARNGSNNNLKDRFRSPSVLSFFVFLLRLHSKKWMRSCQKWHQFCCCFRHTPDTVSSSSKDFSDPLFLVTRRSESNERHLVIFYWIFRHEGK